MNEQILTGKWKELKSELQRTWGKITGDEFEQTRGQMKSIVSLIQQKYGMRLDEAQKRVAEVYQHIRQAASHDHHNDTRSQL